MFDNIFDENYRYNFRYIISLTTIPDRLPKIKKTLFTLLNQKFRIPIILNIPHKFERKNMEYIIPEFITLLEESCDYFKVHRSKDYGPITKFLGGFDFIKSEDPNNINKYVIIIVDDDKLQPESLTQYHVNYHEKRPIGVVGCSSKSITKIIRPPNGIKNPMLKANTDIIEGCGTYSIKLRDIQDDIYDSFNNLPLNCILTDDFILSNYLAYHNIPIRIVKNNLLNEYLINQNLDMEGTLNLNKNTGHKEGLIHRERIKYVLIYLAKNNILHFQKKNPWLSLAVIEACNFRL
jgi:hypothetical protein